jgi:hypothetical protein
MEWEGMEERREGGEIKSEQSLNLPQWIDDKLTGDKILNRTELHNKQRTRTPMCSVILK